jgi:predicted hydrocarbon binding protein
VDEGATPLVAQLTRHDGAILGTLTVEPGRRTRDRHRAAEAPIMAALAAQVATALENVWTLHEMRELKDLNAGIVANVPAGVLRVAADGRVLQANDEAARLLGGSGGWLFAWGVVQANPVLADLVREALEGDEVANADVHLDGDEPTYLTLSAVPMRGATGGAVVMVSDNTARRLADEARASAAVTRPLVRRIIGRLVGKQEVSRRAIAQVGRDLARDIGGHDAQAYASAFRAMGLGTLALAGGDAGSFRFEADDLLEKREGATQPTCHLALGFVEGTVAALTGAPAALGTELRCQSMGHERCVFVAKPMTQPQAVPLPAPSIPHQTMFTPSTQMASPVKKSMK